jgi:hypothetical protein
MPRDRTNRVFALGASVILAALVVVVGAASCLLADPPPGLPNVPSEVPSIVTTSVVPPAGQIFTNWPEGGLTLIVPVQVLNPLIQYQFLLMRDYMTPASSPQGVSFSGPFGPPDPDAGGLEFVPVPTIEKPVDPNCHTYSLFVGLNLSLVPEQSPGQGFTVRASSGDDVVTWTYSPSGGVGPCAAYDAAGLADAAATDAADLDGGMTVPVDGGH